MKATIRAPHPADAAVIAEVHIAAWRETYSHLLPADFFSASYIAGRQRLWRHVLAEPRDDMTVRVAEIDGEIVGFAWVGPGEGQGAEPPPRDRLLYAIYVLARHHGTGTGQALLDETVGEGPAMLWVAKENPRAVAFYLRNGFRFDGVEQTDPYAPLITDARMVR
jgi:GNAT superfamily N-acetyltransferase